MIVVGSWRGGLLESYHKCSLAVVDADGATLKSYGDIEEPVFPRSAVKSIQALPLVESGAWKAVGFDSSELALACSSHSGEADHLAAAQNMLSKCNLHEKDLNCGSSWPYTLKVSVAYAARGGKPRSLVHCCSGKHAGFLCLCKHLEQSTAQYHAPSHLVQQEVLSTLQDVTGHTVVQEPAIDGCSIPAYRFPLKSLAFGMARMATGLDLQRERAKAAATIISACQSHPEMVGGSGRYDTRLMSASNGQVFAKTGAEGIYCGSIPEQGIGIAVKCHDGTTRAAEIAFGSVVEKFLGSVMDNQSERVLKNAAGIEVGRQGMVSPIN